MIRGVVSERVALVPQDVLVELGVPDDLQGVYIGAVPAAILLHEGIVWVGDPLSSVLADGVAKAPFALGDAFGTGRVPDLEERVSEDLLGAEAD